MEDRLVLRLKNDLNELRDEDRFRSLIVKEKDIIDFTSNDYLGLARSTALKNSVITQLREEKPDLGARGSRLLTGNTGKHENLERFLSIYFKGERALLFNSGYSANLAILSSIPKRGDTILIDERCHACIKDGVRLSHANFQKFRHNDLEDLKSKLTKASGLIFIVIESIYSMDGDSPPLNELVNLAADYDAQLIIDEAHSTGLYEDGRGLSIDQGLEQKIFARIYTFGKAIGSYGACIVGSQVLYDYLVNHARTFIYTTAIPEYHLVSLRMAFQYLIYNNHQHWKKLSDNISLFRELTSPVKEQGGGFFLLNESPIQGYVMRDVFKLKHLAEYLGKKGYDVRPILAPTVRKGTERLRIILHSYNSKDEIIGLVSTIEDFNVSS